MNAPIRGVVSVAYRAPWNFDYQCAVNSLLISADISNRGEAGGLLTNAELVEMGDAMQNGLTVEAFAQRIIDRAASEAERAA